MKCRRTHRSLSYASLAIQAAATVTKVAVLPAAPFRVGELAFDGVSLAASAEHGVSLRHQQTAAATMAAALLSSAEPILQRFLLGRASMSATRGGAASWGGTASVTQASDAHRAFCAGELRAAERGYRAAGAAASLICLLLSRYRLRAAIVVVEQLLQLEERHAVAAAAALDDEESAAGEPASPRRMISMAISSIS